MKNCLLFILILISHFALGQGSVDDYVQTIKGARIESVDNIFSLHKGDVYLVEGDKELLTEDFQVIRKLSLGRYLIHLDSDREFDSSVLGDIQLFEVANNWKVEAGLFERINSNPKGVYKITISAYDLLPLVEMLNQFEMPIISIHPESKTIVLVATGDAIFNHLMPDSNILSISYAITSVTEEALVDDLNLTVNRINALHNYWPELKAEGKLISIKEQMFDSSDIDIRNRTTLVGLENETVSAHATQMATIIGGKGNSYRTGKGVATSVGFTASDFNNLVPDASSVFVEKGITIQNHSYGSPLDNRYSTEARAYDLNTNSNPELLHVFSVGNSGMEVSTNGDYANIDGFSNLSGSYKMAKNVLLVGAVDEVGVVNELNSKGPAYDGRLKPELVAYGKGGTSESAALVSGVSLLLNERYNELKGSNSSSTLLKALLLAGSTDVGAIGIDYITGYGSLNALQSMRIIESNQFGEESVNKNETIEIPIDVPVNTQLLKLAVVWNDPAANVEDFKALVNDVNVEVLNTATMEAWRPWLLSTFPHSDSLKKVAKRGIDNLNNVEFFTIELPVEGEYRININGSGLTTSSQNVAYAYQFEMTDKFEWTYPTSNDKVVSNEPTFLRWDSNVAVPSDVEINYNGLGWETLSTNIDLTMGSLNWEVIDELATAQVRVHVNGQYIVSDLFVIAPELDVSVGYVCEDDFLLAWPTVNNASGYEVYNLVGNEMSLISSQLDTIIALNQSSDREPYYSVSPTIDGMTGPRSLAYNYTQQGVGCYYSGFLATNVDNDFVQLMLNLSTTYNVNQIQFERSKDSINFELVNIINPSLGQLSYGNQDDNPLEGYSYYRASVVLEDGIIITTEAINVFFSGASTLLISPNPVASGDFITIQSKGEGRLFELINLQGKVVRQVVLNSNLEELDILLLQRGMYVYRMLENTNKISQGKLIVN